MDMLPKRLDGIQWLVKKIKQFPPKKEPWNWQAKEACLKDLGEIDIPQAVLWLLSSIFVKHTDAFFRICIINSGMGEKSG